MSTKRELPPGLKRVLEADKQVTKQCYEWADRRYGLPNYRHFLKYLEVSCHGLPWLFGNIAMFYLAPSHIELWMNLFILLIVDLAVVAVIKVIICKINIFNFHTLFFKGCFDEKGGRKND